MGHDEWSWNSLQERTESWGLGNNLEKEKLQCYFFYELFFMIVLDLWKSREDRVPIYFVASFPPS